MQETKLQEVNLVVIDQPFGFSNTGFVFCHQMSRPVALFVVGILLSLWNLREFVNPGWS